MAEGEVYKSGNPLRHLPQGGQIQGQALKLVHEQGAYGGDIFAGLTDTGENDPVSPAHIHFR